jgi:alkylated DNA repair dioxygenase AlkB
MSKCGAEKKSDGLLCEKKGKEQYGGRCGIHKNYEPSVKKRGVKTPTVVTPTVKTVGRLDNLVTTILPDPNCYVEQLLILPNEIQISTPELFEEIWDLHPDELGTGVMFGNEISFPRWQGAFGMNYYFTGEDHKARSFDEHPFLTTLLEWVKKDSGIDYNSLLINWYEDGNHYIGYHSDNEKDLKVLDNGTIAPIYSFSYGQDRDFYIRSNKKSAYPGFKLNLVVPNNSCIIMCGSMQNYYKHSVPKRMGKKKLQRRINITFRLMSQ